MPDPFRSKGFGGRRRRRFPQITSTDSGVLPPPDDDEEDDLGFADEEPGTPVSDDDGTVPASPPIYGPGSGASAWRVWMAEATNTPVTDWEAVNRGEIVETAFRRGILHATDPAIKVVLPDEYVDKDAG